MLLVVPKPDPEPWPTLGPQICNLIEERCIYGPGSLKGQPFKIDRQFRGWIYRAYEVFPQGHQWQGRRRFKRAGMSVRKGLAKTEKMSAIAFVELHPEGPVRCDGFDAQGQPVGRPVVDPYIPMLAVTVEQVEELAFGCLTVMCQEGPDAELFDVSLERILRLDEYGRADGKAVPLANSPGARDGARTTLNCFDEPHRLYLPRQRDAHATMDANLPKRVLEDPWSLYVGTAGEMGQGSVAEDIHMEAEQIRDGVITDPQLFYLYRTDDGGHDLKSKTARLQAIAEATGPEGEWGPGQFNDIANQWDRPGADHGFLERVWLNRWVRSGAQAFDPKRWSELHRIGGDPDKDVRPRIPKGAAVTAGFDGARFRDSTALVITEIATGTQEIWGLWEKPALDTDDENDWEVPESEVTESVEDLMRTMKVWRLYADPPYWTETVGAWSGRWPGKVEEWWTNSPKRMAMAVRDYNEAMGTGAVGWAEQDPLAPAFARHIAAAGRQPTQLYSGDGSRLYVLKKIHTDRKFDAAMAGCLSWQAWLAAIKAGQGRARVPTRPRRIR